jgi:ankyrin repeat protein
MLNPDREETSMTHVRRIAGYLSVAVFLATAAVWAAPQAASVADAARRGDLAGLRALLAGGADANAAAGDGMTALHWAAERGDGPMVTLLIASGASVTGRTRIGDYTPLHLAARSGSAPTVTALIKAGAPVDVKTSTGGVQALHLAAGSGSAAAVTALLDQGAKVDGRESEWGQTPLIFAAAANRAEVVKVLIARGANIGLMTTPLDVGRFSTQARQAQTLQRQVLASAVQRGQEPTPTQMQAAIEAVREYYVTGQVPSPQAAGAGAGGRGGRGGAAGAPAQEAALAAPAGGGVAPGGAPGAPRDVNQDTPPPNIAAKGGLSALHHAARQGYLDVVKSLLDAGASLNGKSGDGHSPILIALINGQFDVAVEFTRRGADVNLTSDSHGVTPLWATINARWQPRTRFPQPQEMDQQRANYLDVMTALLEKGADPNARIRVHPWYMVYTDCGNANCGLSNSAGATAFWRAAYGTDVEAMRLLVKFGADPNVPTMAAAGRGGFGGGARGGGAGRGGGAAPGAGDGATPPMPAAPVLDPSGMPPVPGGGPGVYPLHAAAGAEYGEGFAGNAHHHAPEGWLNTVKYLVEEIGADVNSRDSDGYTPMHHAAARGDNEMILYLIAKGADVMAVSRRGQTTVDMANGPVSRISPFPETIALLEKLGAKNNHRCQSC